MRVPGGPMGGYNNRPAPYDSRDRFGGMNRYSLGGRGRTRRFTSQLLYLFNNLCILDIVVCNVSYRKFKVVTFLFQVGTMTMMAMMALFQVGTMIMMMAQAGVVLGDTMMDPVVGRVAEVVEEVEDLVV